MKKKFLMIGLPVIGGLALAGVGIASAAGMLGGGMVAGPMQSAGAIGLAGLAVAPGQWASDQAAAFQAEAGALGLSESVIAAGWAQGETLSQIASANGISSSQLQADLKNYAQTQEQADLQALVSQGTITQAQMASRLQFEQTQAANLKAKGFRGGFGRIPAGN